MKKRFALVISLGMFSSLMAQNIIDSSRYPKPVHFTAQEDHANMMQQLGIQKLRPGPNANQNAPNHANIEEELANPCPVLPDPLVFKNGTKVTTAEQWYTKRRAEISKDFESEMYGSVPANTPRVSWTAKITDYEFVGRTPVIARQMLGHVDNTAYPLIDVTIKMVLVLPTNVKGPVPVLIMLGFPVLPAPAQPGPGDMEKINATFREMMVKANPEMKEIFERYPAYSPITRLAGPGFFAPPTTKDSPPTEQLLAAGWGYCTLDPGSIQADNGAGLTSGIIGLVNKGQPRKPDDWGALRAWAWGASRVLDFLETDSLVDAKKVGIEGVSRYGKAALVTLAFDQRFAT
ncbi:MAG: acetylxylan esterase, partial [Bacteroidota bacterium]|nr:acetylxylan esterase [Bacteroidota bacterium]